MGILRGITKWLVETLLIIAIAFFLLSSTLSHFSEKANLEPIVKEVGMQQFSEEQINMLYDGLSKQCQNQNTETIQMPFAETGQFVQINCTRIKEYKQEEVKSIIKDNVIGPMFDKIYSDCENESSECAVVAGPFNFISKSFKSITKTLEIVSLIAVLIFGALVFVLSKGISGRLIGLGTPFFFSGLPYFFLGEIKLQILAKTPAAGIAITSKIIGSIFDYLAPLFLAVFLLGAALIAAGFIVKFVWKGVKKI